MAYATTDNYIAWLRGRNPTVPLLEFDFWAERASSEIDIATFSRLKDAETYAEHEPSVISANCALAEAIYKAESADATKEIASYSIGGYSESYVKGETKTTQERIYGIIKRDLGMTGLLYRGVI